MIAQHACYRSLVALAVLAANVTLPSAALAKPPEVSITSEAELRFGTFMVFGSGSRTVSSSGLVRDTALVALEGQPTGPARFSISYDRGNESKHVLDIELELVISPPARIRVQGIEAELSAFETDLPGATVVSQGQPIRVNLRNCRTRVCSMSFNVGGRLDVTRQYGGGSLIIPIPVDVSVISVERSRGR